MRLRRDHRPMRFRKCFPHRMLCFQFMVMFCLVVTFISLALNLVAVRTQSAGQEVFINVNEETRIQIDLHSNSQNFLDDGTTIVKKSKDFAVDISRSTNLKEDKENQEINAIVIKSTTRRPTEAPVVAEQLQNDKNVLPKAINNNKIIMVKQQTQDALLQSNMEVRPLLNPKDKIGIQNQKNQMQNINNLKENKPVRKRFVRRRVRRRRLKQRPNLGDRFACPLSLLDIPLPRAHDTKGIIHKDFKEALNKYADHRRTIILLIVSVRYVKMAVNIYRTSLQRLSIRNFLYVCIDLTSATELSRYGIACLLYNSAVLEPTADGLQLDDPRSLYGSKAFKLKTHIKTKVILEALMLDYTVLISDLDIVFFKNPLNQISLLNGTENADIIMQEDGEYQGQIEYNSGFYLVRPTEDAIDLHTQALQLSKTNPELSNQKAIGKVLQTMLLQNDSIKLHALDKVEYQNGLVHFEDHRRSFPTPCVGCVILHNNWIVGAAAKVHRFRAHLMWFVDTNQYYTNTRNKYLLYGNPSENFGYLTKDMEIQAFKNALLLGHILNRIVILPKFHCSVFGCQRYTICRNKFCPLQTYIDISTLDTYFEWAYRPHSFLCHPWVPTEIRHSKYRAPFYINNMYMFKTEGTNVKLIPRNKTLGPTPSDILQWFQKPSHGPMLHIHDLYGSFHNLHTAPEYREIVQKINVAISPSDYRQYSKNNE